MSSQFTFLDLKITRKAIVFGMLWFCAVILFAAAFTPGYSHSFQAVSELAAPGAPFAWLVRFGGFVPLGLIFILFAFANRKHVGLQIFPTVTFVLLFVTGLAIIAAGIFPTDIHGRRNSLSGMAHAVAGIILLISICATPLATALSTRSQRQIGFKIYSIISSLVLTTLFVLLPNGISPALIQLQKAILGDFFTTWYKYQGVDQRALLLVYFIWLFIFARYFLVNDNKRAA